MGNFNENSLGYQSLRDKLSAIILLETSKSYKEMDCGLVDECIDFLMELEGKERLSKEEIKQRIGKIPFKENIFKFNSDAKKKLRAKRIAIVAAIMAIIMAIIGVMSIASEDIFGDLLAKFGKQFVNLMYTDVVEYGGVSMYNADEAYKYDSIEELLIAEKIDMLYPSWLPEGVEINFVKCAVDFGEAEYTICCTDMTFSIIMYPEKDLDERAKTNLCTEINGLKIYYFTVEDFVQCNFTYKNNLYSVTADSTENLFRIIENLKEIN